MTGLDDGLAHVVAVARAQFLGVLVHQIGQAVQQPAALGEPQPGPRPAVEGAARGLDGAVGIDLAAQGDLGPRLAGPRINRVEAGCVGGFGLDAVDHLAEERLS